MSGLPPPGHSPVFSPRSSPPGHFPPRTLPPMTFPPSHFPPRTFPPLSSPLNLSGVCQGSATRTPDIFNGVYIVETCHNLYSHRSFHRDHTIRNPILDRECIRWSTLHLFQALSRCSLASRSGFTPPVALDMQPVAIVLSRWFACSYCGTLDRY